MTNDRIQLLNYTLSIIPLLNAPARQVTTLTTFETDKLHTESALLFNGNMSVIAVINFVWRDLFTSWDRILYEFENPTNFSKKEFKVITSVNLQANVTYQRLLDLQYKTNDKVAMYNLISSHVSELYNVFTTKHVKFSLFEKRKIE